MIRALYSAASGMSAQQLNVDNIAHNLANANTAGFKMRRAQFQDLLYQTLIQPGNSASQQASVPTGLQLGLGTRASSNEIIFAQGNFLETNNPFDLVIQGNGFFQIRRANGELAYTRAGSFHLDRDGMIVNADGEFLEPRINLPLGAQSVTISQDGTVSYTLQGQNTVQNAGQIPLAQFLNPAGLNSLGRNLYMPTEASGEPTLSNPGGADGVGSLLQGFIEQSNVSVVQEFINLIMAQRAYEANSKVVKAADEMYQQVNNLSR